VYASSDLSYIKVLPSPITEKLEIKRDKCHVLTEYKLDALLG